jgi:dephospho-CoA kinase
VPAHRPALRLAVVGLSGCGKSTTAGLIERFADDHGLSHAVVKLARPLYQLQSAVYRAAGVDLAPGAQDQVLLEQLAGTLRRIRPDALVADFLQRLSAVDADVVVNDDLRDPDVDAVALRAHGFRVLRVTADPPVRAARLAGRGDLSRADGSTARLDLIPADAVLDNSGSLDALNESLRRLLGRWL